MEFKKYNQGLMKLEENMEHLQRNLLENVTLARKPLKVLHLPERMSSNIYTHMHVLFPSVISHIFTITAKESEK